MTIKLPGLNLGKIVFLGFCLLALIGFFLPAFNAHFSIMETTHTSSFGMASLFDSSLKSANQNDLLGRFDAGVINIRELTEQFQVKDIFEDAIRPLVFGAASYFLSLFLLLAVIALFILDRFNLIRFVLNVLALALLIVSGAAFHAVPEIALDCLSCSFGETAKVIFENANLHEILVLEYGAGFVLTIFALCAMLLAGAAIFARQLIPAQEKSVPAKQEPVQEETVASHEEPVIAQEPDPEVSQEPEVTSEEVKEEE
ncbi:MAG: hypothetical protein FWC01_00485 [Treponema sp.]|nr:hypothetical protein [Treponema sp.]MCL2237372.1 hypothetical protein [Treponema sp.]